MNSNRMKWVALLGSLLTGGSLMYDNQLEQGLGIIMAALSSASVFGPSRANANTQ